MCGFFSTTSLLFPSAGALHVGTKHTALPLTGCQCCPHAQGLPAPSTAPPVAWPGAGHSPTWTAAGCVTCESRTGQLATLHIHLWPSRCGGMEDAALQQCQAWPPAPGPSGPPPVALSGGTTPGPLSLVYGKDSAQAAQLVRNEVELICIH